LITATKKASAFPEVVWENEKTWRNPQEIEKELLQIWQVMKDCVYRGCHTEGTLPGGLNVSRRAARINKKLLPEATYKNADEWISTLRTKDFGFFRNSQVDRLLCHGR
jgi:L-serine dehydratase